MEKSIINDFKLNICKSINNLIKKMILFLLTSKIRWRKETPELMRRNTLEYVQGMVFKGDMEKPIINDFKLNSLQIN